MAEIYYIYNVYVYLWLHWRVLSPFALSQTFCLPPLKELAPKALLGVKPGIKETERE